MAEIFRPPFLQVESSAGVPVSGAKLYFYQAGTTTDQAVYQDSGLTTPHAQPVVADASGIFAAIYLSATTYKVVLKDASDVTIKTYDNINTTASSNSVLDGSFLIQNTADTTKQIAFSASGITTGTTRTFTWPDVNGTVLTTGNTATLAQALGGSSTAVVLAPNTLAQERALGTQPVNLGLVASVGSSALTIAVKGIDGNDPSATNPVTIPFRNVTAATGTPTYLTLTAALSLTVSSGSTLGMTSAVASTLIIVIFNDGGTARLGIVNPLQLPFAEGIASSTAEGGAGAADTAGVIYTGTAVTSKAMTVIGYATATEATAGTWATAPATLQIASGASIAATVVPMITPWVTYTPTFTGFGTAASVSFWSRRVGDTLEIEGVFSAGTPTATEARVTLGYNGTNANVTSDATKVASIRLAGNWATDNSSLGQNYLSVLIESAVGYITFGYQSASGASLTKLNGSSVASAGSIISVRASIPITGW